MSQITQAIVLAAGQGTRMLHLTKNKSKHLINVFHKPFLSYLLENLLKAGYKNLVIVAGYRIDLFRKFLEEYHFQARLLNQYEILGDKQKEYGTLCPLKCVKGIAQKNFLVVYGDNLYSVRDLKAFNIADDYDYVAGFESNHPERYGVLHLEDGFLKEIIEKPKKFVGRLINTGLYKFTQDIFRVIPEVKPSPRGEYELTDAVNILAKTKRVKVKKLKDYWIDFGRPGDILKFSRFLRANKTFASWH